ncbi:MAG: SDR family NAD(P)-dependent oxidoreductase [Myxococcota bacterium]|nr:SDR family NAD(P)-dependent oxidoreductase [Myxococcota bacterium]
MVVLITGASGGLGQVLGRTLSEKGLRVTGTMRAPEGREDEFPFPMIAMDATDSSSVEKCIQTLLEREGRIDVVINCVNKMIIGTVEEETVEEVEALYQTAVFGMLRVCKAVLPVMREQGGGTIVNMSSLGGILAVPMMSAYTSAKFAIEAMSEALYHEVKGDGIDVVIMQPVAMKMERGATGSHLEMVEGVQPGSRSHKMLERMTADTEASKLTPEAVSERIHQVITSKHKPLRVPMDRAKALGLVKRLAPQSLIDRLIGGLLG